MRGFICKDNHDHREVNLKREEGVHMLKIGLDHREVNLKREEGVHM